jgi:hypothetical protein
VSRFIDGCHRPLSRHRDVYGQFWSAILDPEKRTVGGSTPPLTTHSDLPERARGGHFGCCRGGSRLNSVSFALSGRSAFAHVAAGRKSYGAAKRSSSQEAVVIKTRPWGHPAWFDQTDGDASVARGEEVTAPVLALWGEQTASATGQSKVKLCSAPPLHASQRSGQLNATVPP